MKINPNVSKLDLSNHDLDRIPDEVFRLKNLRKLNLSNNSIKVIPKKISQLKRLENIDLSNNNISEIYAGLFNLSNLQVLVFNNNKIRNLPIQIKKLNKLKKLHISSNYLKYLPKEICQLEMLQELNIANNEFTKFPKEVLSLGALKRLWVNNNAFEDFPNQQALTSRNKLEKFYCYGYSKNGIYSLNPLFKKFAGIRGNTINGLFNNEKKEKQVLAMNQINKKDSKSKIFISYSRSDKVVLGELKIFLKSMQNEGLEFDYWDDTKIKSGDNWKIEIEKALDNSNIALLIVSSAFLSSDFIVSNELPQIFENVEKKGTKILPLIISPCRFTSHPILSNFQSVNDPKSPLSKLSKNDKDEIYLQLTYDIEDSLRF